MHSHQKSRSFGSQLLVFLPLYIFMGAALWQLAHALVWFLPLAGAVMAATMVASYIWTHIHHHKVLVAIDTTTTKPPVKKRAIAARRAEPREPGRFD